MDARQKADLDLYITGDYGEDSGNARQLSRTETDDGQPVPTCTCNSPHITVHASWCEQYEFWNL